MIFKVRAFVMKIIKPRKNYFLFPVPKKSLKPISNVYGFDRGLPIDRYYIEKFLNGQASYIKGVCLEIHDTHYIKKYGGNKVAHADGLDIDRRNKIANIYGDLRHLDNMKSNTYDCLIITHTFGVIDDYEAAISECARILKPGGAMLVTVTAIGPAHDVNINFWRFTTASMRYVLGKYFDKKTLFVRSYGNVLAGQCFWVGLGTEELTRDELDYDDPHFPIIIGARVTKK